LLALPTSSALPKYPPPPDDPMRKTFHQNSASGQALTWLLVVAMLCIGGLMGYMLHPPGRQPVNPKSERGSTSDQTPSSASGEQTDQANTKRTQLTKAPSEAPTELALQARPEVDPKPNAGNATHN
jgi:hypothetical protein